MNICACAPRRAREKEDFICNQNSAEGFFLLSALVAHFCVCARVSAKRLRARSYQYRVVPPLSVHVDLWTDELRFIRLGLFAGNKGFYNLLTAGLQPFDGITLRSIGYGLGVQIYLAPKDYLDSARTRKAYLKRLWLLVSGGYGMVSRLRFFYGHELAKNFTIFLGPTVNWGIYTPLGANAREPFLAISEVALPFGPGSQQFVVSRVWISVSGGFRF